MKKIIFALAILLMFSACATQQNFTASDKSQSIIQLDKIMNEWHHAGAVADEDVFFGRIADDGVYLGTDETERWTKPQFVEWGMKYFTTRDTAGILHHTTEYGHFRKMGKLLGSMSY